MIHTDGNVRRALNLAIAAAMFCVFGIVADGQTQPAQGAAASGVTRTYRITDKPRAQYTEQAKYNGVEGSVRLRVELLANGTVGAVTPLSSLPYGLTEQAIAAARKIKFQPKLINGQPVDEMLTAEYTFSLYYDDDDPEITSRVMVTRMPRPKITAAELPAEANGKVTVKVYFGANGQASVVNMMTSLPEELRQRVQEAVAEIRFRPAIHRSGKRSGVSKTIVYDF
ncbi:MAG TPA: TonB family protein [Pyrinomonadaceae bacterium]|nr:TonB family protein [Pyrinomonadaceae bacterium]